MKCFQSFNIVVVCMISREVSLMSSTDFQSSFSDEFVDFQSSVSDEF